MGHEAIIMPLSYFTYNLSLVRMALKKPYAAVAITSAEALCTIPEEISPSLDTIVFAVGNASAAAAQNHGFKNIFSGTGNGISLAKEIIKQRDILSPEKPLLYLAGRPRSPGFEETLCQNFIPFTAIDCYLAHDISYSSKDTERLLAKIDVILFYSRENVVRFFALPLPDRIMARFLCLSAQVASAIPDPYKKDIAVANSPDENALLELL